MKNYLHVLIDLDKDIAEWEGYMQTNINTFGRLALGAFNAGKTDEYFLELIELKVIVDYKFIPLADLFDMVSKWAPKKELTFWSQ